MKLILALGNPGDRYRDSRHNAGWWLADHLAVRWSLDAFRTHGPEATAGGRFADMPVTVVKPLTYMNLSGRVLKRYLERADFRFKEDLLVLVDDVALAPGRFRLRGRGSAGGHNGLASVESALGGREYGRLRVGVGGPAHPAVDLSAWVLTSPPAAEEEMILEQFDRMAEATEEWIVKGMESAMNSFNRD